jgi:hypothetical protein
MRFMCCYFVEDDPDRVQEAAPKHAAYWRSHAPVHAEHP